MMRYSKLSAMVMLVLATAIVATPAAQGRAEVTLRAAREAEAVKGDLKQAAALYERAVAEAGARGPVAAQALVGLGTTYQKLGRAEAPAVFARVVRDFADQPTAVAAARVAMSAGRPAASVATAQAGASARRVMEGDPAFILDVSADGRLAVGTEFVRRDIVIREIATNRTSVLVPGGASRNPLEPRITDNGDSVAFSRAEPDGNASLWMIKTATGATPIPIPTEANANMIPVGWSVDGRELLATTRRQATTATLRLVAYNTETGTSRLLRTYERWRAPYSFQRSHDGSQIAYSAVAAEGSADRYIFTASTAGDGNEAAVVRMAGENVAPVWTPDGEYLMFLNIRGGQTDLRAIRMRAGEPVGESFLVQRNFPGSSLFVTRAGDLIYSVTGESGFSEFVAERNPAGSPIVQTFKGQSGTWSKGNRLAFIRAGGNSVADLIVRNVATGEERTFSQPGGFGVQSKPWLHDDSALIVGILAAVDGTPGGAYARLDLATGKITRIASRHTSDHERTSGVLVARDNKSIYATRKKDARSRWTGVVAIDLATGVETPMFDFPGSGVSTVSGAGFGWALSPDGTTIAMNLFVEGSTTRSRLVTVKIDGSDWRELHTWDSGHWVDILRWTPDGQSLLFIHQPVGSPTWRMMRISATGGPVEFDGLDSANLVSTVPLPKIELRNIANFDVSPDGTHVVFGSRTIAMHELWTLDNILTTLAQASR